MSTTDHPVFGECEEIEERLGGCVGEVPDPNEPRNGTLRWHRVVKNLVSHNFPFVAGSLNKTACGKVYASWATPTSPAGREPCPDCWP